MLLPLPEVFKKELEKDVAGDTSGNFAKLLMALLQVALMLIVVNRLLKMLCWNKVAECKMQPSVKDFSSLLTNNMN